ncbi:MAG: NUDIX domain-containing protein [Bacilli bacterium]|nr:NUDIX domain-containing protein [Bacilli bacterium]
MKKSAGILFFKREEETIKVLLCHPGGPYWEGTHLHSWGIPKGELDKKEKVKEAAIREFKEETNLKLEGEITFLYTKKVSNNKLVIIFYKEQDLDLSNCKSNTFSLEWPKGSNIINEYPENDKFEWIEIEEAYNLIFKQQKVFLDKLKERIINK